MEQTKVLIKLSESDPYSWAIKIQNAILETQGKSETPPLSPLKNKEHTYRVQ